tara:strand:+ start:7234 stop:7518 length:285 start_codon:yes stop_codon:yes gene_type:complete
MHPCFCRHRALAFGGGAASKTGSNIRDAKPEDKDPLVNYINNSDHVDEEMITKMDIKNMKGNKNIKKIHIPEEEEETDADDIDAFSQYSVMVYT